MYIQLDSQIIYYERTGEGSPVILLHGNNEDHHIFDKLSDKLSVNHDVYAIDLRGHGLSATPKEYHYMDMAKDVVNLIKALEIQKPALVGFSDGAIVSLLVAIEHSELLSAIVCCGANLTPDGIKFGEMHSIKKNWKQTNDLKSLMMIKEPDISSKMLGEIKVPAYVVAGEKDCIKEKETKLIASSVKDSKLDILPGEDHYSYIVDNDFMAPKIEVFLAGIRD